VLFQMAMLHADDLGWPRTTKPPIFCIYRRLLYFCSGST